MKLKEIMNEHMITVESGTDLNLARHSMIWAGVRHLPVIDHEHKLIGLLSERDFLSQMGHERDHAGKAYSNVDSIMTTNVQTAGANDSVTEAAARLAESNIGCLPITNKGVLVALVTRTDILSAQVRQAMTSRPSTIIARDLMTTNPATVLADDYLLDAAGRMQSLGIRHLPVVNGANKLVGMLSDRDIRAAIGDPTRAHDDEQRVELNLLRVSHAMTKGLFTVGEEQTLASIAGLFVERRLSAAPVINSNDELVGIISYLDLLRAERD